MDVVGFRTTYPEFDDSGLYPDATVNYWLGVTAFMLNPDRWAGDLNDLGTGLFVAHHIVLEKMALDTANVGGWPGLNKGVISSEGSQTSLSYDTGSVLQSDAAHWNYTVYGVRFIMLSRLVGAGPVQVGTGFTNAVGSFPGVITPQF